jgi:hypothetical protein
VSDRDQQRQDEAPTEANASEPLLNGERRETLIRGLLIILFALIYSIAELVVGAIVLLQFGFVLITGERNAKLLELGARTSAYIYQILQYVTFNSDLRPFPFSDWPERPTSDGGPPPPP